MIESCQIILYGYTQEIILETRKFERLTKQKGEKDIKMTSRIWYL